MRRLSPGSDAGLSRVDWVRLIGPTERWRPLVAGLLQARALAGSLTHAFQGVAELSEKKSLMSSSLDLVVWDRGVSNLTALVGLHSF